MGALADYLQFVLMPQMFNGLTIGVAVILMALGLTIIFGLLDVFNMAHGEFYALGAYLGVTLASRGVSFWALLVVVPLVLLPVGFLVDRALIQRVFHQKERHMLTMLLTFGLAIVMEDLFRAVYGANTLKPDSPLQGGTELLGNFFPTYRLFLVGIGTVTILGVWLIVNRTRFGAMVRAAALDRHMAASLGVPVQRVYSTPSPSGSRSRGSPASCSRPSTRCSPPWGRTSSSWPSPR